MQKSGRRLRGEGKTMPDGSSGEEDVEGAAAAAAAAAGGGVSEMIL